MRRPVSAEFSAIASNSGREHHCTPAGPNCTSIFGPDIADAIASVSAIVSRGDIAGLTNISSTVLRSSADRLESTGSLSPYTTGFWSRIARAADDVGIRIAFALAVRMI